MFVIQITGGRGFNIPSAIYDGLKPFVDTYGKKNIIVRHGGARGADQHSEFQARRLGISNIQSRPVTDEEWKRVGKAAGNIRNIAMLEEEPKPDVVLAFPDENSRGTWNMIDFAKERGITVMLFAGALSPDNPKLKAFNANEVSKQSEPTITVGNRHKGDKGIYVGRPTPLGNPFVLETEADRPRILEQYEQWLDEQLQDPDSAASKEMQRLADLATEQDVKLICSCSPRMCHADVIKQRLEGKLGKSKTSIERDVEFGETQELSAAMLYADEIWPGSTVSRLPTYSDLDFVVTWRGETKAFLEIKARRVSVNDYTTTMIPLRKHHIAKQILDNLKVPTLAIIVFEDALVSFHLALEPDDIRYVQRDDRSKGMDHAFYSHGRFTFHMKGTPNVEN
jgi:hypothetical protein